MNTTNTNSMYHEIHHQQHGETSAANVPAAADESSSSFDAAVAALYGDTHQAMTRDAIRAAGARRHRTIDDMREYMNRIGLSAALTQQKMKNKRLIHITGTKGKGSTAAMCECICRKTKSWTTGLFTSPHLIDIRERIRINGQPVSKQVFAQAYWEIRRRLENYKKSEDDSNGNDDLPILPGYFRTLSLLAMFIFSHHAHPTIDVIILEVGLGGRYDATNILDLDWFEKSVCGVTLIDYDHVRILGHSLEEIAWEKGGLFQVVKQQQLKGEATKASPRPLPTASSTPQSTQQQIFAGSGPEDMIQEDETDHQRQQDTNMNGTTTTSTTTNGRVFYSLATNTNSVLAVLQTCAHVEGRGGHLVTVSSAKIRSSTSLALGLHGDHQWDNAALAIALCTHVMNMDESSSNESPATRLDKHDDDNDRENEMYRALSLVSWPGRCQTIHHNDDITFYVDGAHTLQSLKAGLEWFQQQTTSVQDTKCNSRRLRALLFNCSHEREPVQLLQLLLHGGGGHSGFDVVFACRPNSDRPSSIDKTNALELLQSAGYSVQQDDGSSTTKTSNNRTWQDTLLEVWKYLMQHELKETKTTGSTNNPPTTAQVTASNLTAVEALRRLEDIMAGNKKEFESSSPVSGMDVFVTGSLYLAGSMLEALEWTEDSQTEGHLAF